MTSKKRNTSFDKTNFFESVFDIVMLIPKGRVTTYGAIAKFISSQCSARTVGWALNSSHSSSNKIPAHRVVNRKGMLTGKFHFKTLTTMQNRLEKEGIIVINDEIQNFDKILWDPTIELLK